MKYNKTVLSAVTMALLMTGCVKPTEEVNTTTNTDTVVYDDQPTVIYEDATPTTTYEDATVSSGVVYDTTVTATDSYQPAAGSTTTGGAYGDIYSSGSGGGDIYSGGSGGDIYMESTPYVGEDPYPATNTYSSGATSTASGIHLQVAALKDYYAAEEFRKGLSLDPKYGSYVKRGAMNKVIVTGIPSRAEAKALAARQFPGAFIVGGSPTSYSSGSSTSYSSSSTSYTPAASSSSSYTNNGIGVQIGAFSTKSAARNAAESAAQSSSGRYTAIVKTVNVRGKTMYKAILIGFASRQAAKNAIASGQFGDAFVVSDAYQ